MMRWMTIALSVAYWAIGGSILWMIRRGPLFSTGGWPSFLAAGGFAAWFLLLGVGLFRRREWARRLVAGFSLVMALLAAGSLAVQVVRIAAAGSAVLPAAVALGGKLVWLLFFGGSWFFCRRESVRDEFLWGSL